MDGNSTWRWRHGYGQGRGMTHRTECSHLKDITFVKIRYSVRWRNQTFGSHPLNIFRSFPICIWLQINNFYLYPVFRSRTYQKKWQFCTIKTHCLPRVTHWIPLSNIRRHPLVISLIIWFKLKASTRNRPKVAKYFYDPGTKSWKERRQVLIPKSPCLRRATVSICLWRVS